MIYNNLDNLIYYDYYYTYICFTNIIFRILERVEKQMKLLIDKKGFNNSITTGSTSTPGIFNLNSSSLLSNHLLSPTSNIMPLKNSPEDITRKTREKVMKFNQLVKTAEQTAAMKAQKELQAGNEI